MSQWPPSSSRRGPVRVAPARPTRPVWNSTSAPEAVARELAEQAALGPRRAAGVGARAACGRLHREVLALAVAARSSRACATAARAARGRRRRRPPKAHTQRLAAVGAVGDLAALLVDQRRARPAQQGVARGVVPGRGPVAARRPPRPRPPPRAPGGARCSARARKRAGVTQARLPAGSESPALDTRTTSCGPRVSGRDGSTGRPLRVSGPQPSAQAKRSPSSSGYANAKTTPRRGTSAHAAGRSRPRCLAGP